MNFQMFKLVLEKAEEPEIKLPTSVGNSKWITNVGSSKKQESSRKTSSSVLLTTPKSLTVWLIKGNILGKKAGEIGKERGVMGGKKH